MNDLIGVRFFKYGPDSFLLSLDSFRVRVIKK